MPEDVLQHHTEVTGKDALVDAAIVATDVIWLERACRRAAISTGCVTVIALLRRNGQPVSAHRCTIATALLVACPA